VVSRFLLVSLIMDAVLENATIHQRRQTLCRMTNGIGVDDEYSATLSRIQEQKGNKLKLGMEAVRWVSHSERPLKAQELCHALAVEVGTTDLNVHNVASMRPLLSCTLGLIIVDEQISTVRLVHFTLQEYLSAHPTLFITPHSVMAEICLTYLNFRSTSLNTITSTTPSLPYSSCYWGFHARKEITEGVKPLALRHLKRDATHISADILLREEAADFLSWGDCHDGIRPDLRGFTGLHCIAYMGITEIAIAMIDMERWDLNGRDLNGATPLIWTIQYGNFALANVLLEQEGIDTTLSDNHGLTPLTHAAKVGQEGLVKLFKARGEVDPNSRDLSGRTPLFHAARSGHAGVVAILLGREDICPDSPYVFSQTPLSLAAKSGHEGVVKILLERGNVNPDSSHKSGRTPLSHSAQWGEERVVKMLLGREDVNPDSSNRDGRTPLSYAVESGHEGVVKTLLERGNVNPNSSGRIGWTPLSYAASRGC